MTVYYVDPAGSDGAAGTAPGTAWATLAKVSGFSFTSGDQILFKRGGTWRGTSNPLIQVSASNLYFGDYGTGAKPYISGGDLVTGWSLSAGSTYQAAMAVLPASIPVIITFTVGGVTTRLEKGSGSGSLTAFQWFHTGGQMFINLGGVNPTTGVVEIARRIAMDSFNRSAITIQNISFAYGHDGILALADAPASGHQVLDCDFKWVTMDNHAGCIYYRRNVGSAGCKVLRCTFDQLANEAVYVDRTLNVEVGFCTLTNVGGMLLDQQSDGIQIEASGAAESCNGFWIHDNSVSMGTATVKGGILVNSFPSVGSSATGIVERNTCIGGNWGIAPHSSGVIVRNNICTGQSATNQQGIWIDGSEVFTGIVITYNLIYGCYFGINGGSSANARQVTIAQNTIANCTRAHLILDNPIWGLIANNILWNNGAAPTLRCMYIGSVSGLGTLTINNQLYNAAFASYLYLGGFVDASTLAAWKAGNGGRDAAAFSADPMFVSP